MGPDTLKPIPAVRSGLREVRAIPQVRSTHRKLRAELGLALDPAGPLTLQNQIRQKLIDAIARGVLRPGRRLPSSRDLARQAGVARNTVILAYDALVAAGHLVNRPRSGVFVADAQGDRVTTGRRGLARTAGEIRRGALPQVRPAEFRRPPNWHQHPYPFLDGCIDAELVPTDQWRESLRIAFGKRDLLRWSNASHLDDAQLTEELRANVLPAWGVDAAPEEILFTASVRHALHLVLTALVTRNTQVWVDSAVDPDTRHQLDALQAQVMPLELSGAGPRVAPDLAPRSVVLLGPRSGLAASPGRSRAQALISAIERSDSALVECVTTAEVREARRGLLSLRALAPEARVILVGSLSQVAALGTPPALVSASGAFTEQLRELRRLGGGEVSPGLQRAWAYFIGLGHYAAAIARASAVLQERRTALRDALNHYLHKFVSIHTHPGASAYWVKGGPDMDAAALARAAGAVGILIEPGASADSDHFCMGVTGIPRAKIREGVERLARLVRGDPRLGSRTLANEPGAPLRGRALQRAMAGTTLLYNTVYGEPCTIQVRADGTLTGSAGYADEDQDQGRWWIDDGRWFRQWNSWAYAEVVGFHTVIDADQVRWFNAEGLLVDTAVIARAAAAGDRRRA